MANVRHFTFHALRHTFASRAMEQGMDAKTLSVILGHSSVSFTLDTYAHVLNEHKHESMALMEELFYSQEQCFNQSNSYPIIITTLEDGNLHFQSPDFPTVTFEGNDFAGGMQYIKERLSEEVLTATYLPKPALPGSIPLTPNQTVFVISL